MSTNKPPASAAGLRIRKHADKSAWDGQEHTKPEVWPTLGVELFDAPDNATIATTTVERGLQEGWITIENEHPVHLPGGSVDRPWKVTHTFIWGDVMVFSTRPNEADLRYVIERNPGKYYPDGTVCDQAGVPEAVVDWFYTLRKEVV